MNVRPFHLALPTEDLELTRLFYCDILGCETGRTSDDWIDLDFFGHQLVFHVTGAGPYRNPTIQWMPTAFRSPTLASC